VLIRVKTTRIGNAYGVCVIFVTFITTCLVSLVAILVWRVNIFIVIFFFLVFGALDGAYLSAALTKVPSGAWFTIMLACILSCVFVLWRFGKEQQWAAEREDRFQPSHLLSSTEKGDLKLTAAYGGSTVSKTPGIGIFFDKAGDMVPIVFAQFVRKFSARPEIIIFFHMRPLSMPSIPESERFVIQRTSIPGCYRITVRHGYTDSIVSPDLGRLIVGQLTLFITRGNSLTESPSKFPPAVQAELDALNNASTSQLSYVMGKEEMKIRHGTNIFRKVLLMMFLWMRENSRTKMAEINIPTDSLVEMGFVKEI
jgi:KUP system potassium uptake protein